MAYNKTTWEDNITPINADNLNNIEDGVEDADSRISSIEENYIYFATEEEWEEQDNNE